MQLESLESMIKDYERRTGEHVSLEGFISMKIITTKTNTITISNGSLMRVSYSGLLTNMRANGILLSGKHTVIWKVIGKYIVEVMKMNNLDVIVTATHRSVRGFIKKWNMERVPTMDYTHNGFNY